MQYEFQMGGTTKDFGTDRVAALSYARKATAKDGDVGYVVTYDNTQYGTLEAVGHMVYAHGVRIDQDGVTA